MFDRSQSKRASSVSAILFAFALGMIAVLSACAPAPSSSNTISMKPVEGTFSKISETPVTKSVVTVGLYINNLFDLQASNNTFYLSGYMWLRWKGDGDPLANLEFTNAVAGPFVRQPLYPEPVTLANGEKYQVIRLQGRFFDPYDLSNYPLDHQHLSIYLENTTDTLDLTAYVPDTTASGFDQNMAIPGWHIKSLSSQTYIHDYGTDFGMLADASASKYSTLEFSMATRRNLNQFYWKLLFPMLIVLAAGWLGLIISPDMIGLRTGMPVSVLLTMVFMHLGTKQEISQYASLVLADKIYILSYIMILATLAQIIWVNTHLDQENKTNLQEMKRVDRTGLVVQVAVFMAVLAYFIISARP